MITASLLLLLLVAVAVFAVPALRQNSDTVRNARNDAWETAIGTGPLLRIRTGSQPANCAASRTGTVLVSMTLPSDWMGNSASGVKSKSGTWSGTASASGTAGHYEIMDSTGTTCHEQGSVGVAFTINTSASTAANGNVLTFASTTGVAVGQKVTGTGIPTTADVTVIALTSTTVTLSHASTAGVSSGVTITFGFDLNVENTSINSAQVVSVSTFSVTEGNA